MGRSQVALALVLGVTFFAEVARAEPKVAVTSSCATVWRPFLDQLAIELSEEGIKIESDGTDAELALRLDATDCGTGGAPATLRASAPGHGERSRRVELAGIAPETRSRVLAMAAAELLRGILHEPAAAAPAPAARATPPSPVVLTLHFDPPPPPPSASRSPLALGLAFEVRSFPTTSTTFGGARLAFDLPITRSFVLTVDGGVAAAQQADALGSVSFVTAGGGVGLALRADVGPLRVQLGPDVELDALFVRGTPAPGVSAIARTVPIVLLGARADLFARVAEGFQLVVGLDAGGPLLGYRAEADTRAVGGIVGPMLGVRLGFAWSPP